MSYDLAVFEKPNITKNREIFLRWYEKQVEWSEEFISAAFSWSLAEEACTKTKALALKYGVGFFNTSASNGEIIFPDGTEV